MTNSEKQYFTLLQAAIWNREVNLSESIDWEAVLALAKYHATSALICDAALRMNDGQMEGKLLNWMTTFLRSELVLHLRLRQVLLMAVDALHKKGIEPVLLKGFALAQFYPNPNLRQFGDIDLYVGLDHFHEACAVLRTLPGSYNWDPIEKDVGRHYNIEFGEFALEIHRVSSESRDPKENALYLEMERQGLVLHPQKVEIEGCSISIPSPTFTVFYTFYHAWYHLLYTGVGWRQMCDITLALHAYHGQLDLDQLAYNLQTLHLMKPWQAFGYLMVEQLGLPEAEMPFYDVQVKRTARKLYRCIMEEGNFNRKKTPHKANFKLWQKMMSS